MLGCSRKCSLLENLYIFEKKKKLANFFSVLVVIMHVTCSRLSTLNILFKTQNKFVAIYIMYSIQKTYLKFRL